MSVTTGKISGDATVPFKPGLFIPAVDMTLALGAQNVKLLASSLNVNSQNNILTPQQYGAVGDGVHDDTLSLQAMYNAVPAGGGVVMLPTGVYLISSAVVIPTSNIITYGNGSEVRTNDATDDLFVLPAGAARLTFYDLSLWATLPKTAGACFKALGIAKDCNFYNVQCGSLDNYDAITAHRLWNGWDFRNGFFRIHIDPGCVGIVANYGAWIAGNNAAEVNFYGRFLYCAKAIYIAGGAGGVYVDGEISVCGTGVQCDKTVVNAINREIFLAPNAVIDGCADYGVQILADSVAVLDVSGSWIASSGRVHAGQGVGIFMAPNAGLTPYGTAKITGAQFYNNTVAGLVNSGMEALVSGCAFTSNATGYVLETSGAAASAVVGNHFLNNTSVGLTLQNGLTTYTVQSNMFVGNPTAINGTSVGYTSGASVASSNWGYPSRTAGSHTMASGTSSVTFSHGLVGTPGFVSITTSDPAHSFAVSAVDATNLTVVASAAVSGAVTIWWSVSMSVGANP